MDAADTFRSFLVGDKVSYNGLIYTCGVESAGSRPDAGDQAEGVNIWNAGAIAMTAIQSRAKGGSIWLSLSEWGRALRQKVTGGILGRLLDARVIRPLDSRKENRVHQLRT